MKISLNLLKTFVDLKSDPYELAEQLTMLGQEVDSIELMQNSHVVIGQIDMLGKHPNSERLTLCKVNVGEEVLDIVCGANNHRQGDKVAVARIGAKIKGHDIKESEIRGAKSAGMICSSEELGLQASEGVLILDPSAPIGQNFFEYSYSNDALLHLSITPNRPDVLSHLGLARELAALYRKRLPMSQSLDGKFNESPFEDARLYRAFRISGVKVKDSPAWLKRSLSLFGVKSINNLVDVSNFVMFELGHPTHFFDAATVEGKIGVRSAFKGECIKCLDGEEYLLDASDLVVADEKKAIAIAGVMGSEETGVTQETQEVILEIAHFNENRVRRTSKKLNLSTEASYRFERGVDTEDSGVVAHRIIELLKEVSGFEGLEEIMSFKSDFSGKTISIELKEMNDFLGSDISLEDTLNILESLNLAPQTSGGAIISSIPSYRLDLSREVDIYEEVARIYGYGKIRPLMPLMQLRIHEAKDDELRNKLVAMGLNEVINYSFVPKGYGELEISNPINEEFAVMRDSLFFSLMKNVEYNLNKGAKKVALFELGRVYSEAEGDRLGLALAGYEEKGFYNQRRELDFFDLKGIVESLKEQMKWDISFNGSDDERLHPGRRLSVVSEGKKIGSLGEAHPRFASEFGLKRRVYLLEMEPPASGTIKIENLSKYPYVERELAIVFNEEVKVGEMLREVCEHELIKEYSLLDIYRSASLGNKKSVAFRFLMQSDESTLTEGEIEEIVASVLSRAKERYDGDLRVL